jgi:hypothetical protein
VQVKVARDPKHKADFSKRFQHVVIHPGAVKVIDGVRSALGFGDKAAIPSLQTLNRFGNTSSSSTLYILANVESRIGVKKGDNVLQLAMGSGFKYGPPLTYCDGQALCLEVVASLQPGLAAASSSGLTGLSSSWLGHLVLKLAQDLSMPLNLLLETKLIKR